MITQSDIAYWHQQQQQAVYAGNQSFQGQYFPQQPQFYQPSQMVVNNPGLAQQQFAVTQPWQQAVQQQAQMPYQQPEQQPMRGARNPRRQYNHQNSFNSENRTPSNNQNQNQNRPPRMQFPQQPAGMYYPPPQTQPQQNPAAVMLPQPAVELLPDGVSFGPVNPDSMQGPLAPGVNMIIQQQPGGGLMFPSEQDPAGLMPPLYPAQPIPPIRRKKNPIPIINPKDDKPVIVSAPDDSGYPSEASTPNSAIGNGNGYYPSLPSGFNQIPMPLAIETMAKPPNLVEATATSTPDTLTPSSATADNSPTVNEEASATAEQGSPALEAVTEEKQRNDTPIESATTVESPKQLSEQTVQNAGDDDDADDDSASDSPIEFKACPPNDVIDSVETKPSAAPVEAVSNNAAAAPKPATAINSFFNSVLAPLRRPAASPSPPPSLNPVQAVKRAEMSKNSSSVENSDEESLKRENSSSDIKRSYSRSVLLELKGNGNAFLPRNASIPKDIAVELPPTKRLLKTRSPAEEICRELRGTLNKMTIENYELMSDRIYTMLSNDKDERMQKVDDKFKLFTDFVGIIFAKAISEPKLADLYARMFINLSKIQFTDSEHKQWTFRRVMLNYCQREFEEHDHGSARQVELEQDMAKAKTEAEIKDASENLQEFKNVQKAKYLGNIRFIGELYRNYQLSLSIMTSCITRLLAEPSEDTLESLCKLLRDVGKMIEDEIYANRQQSEGKNLFTWWRQECLAKLHKFAKEKETSSRIRFFIHDVLKARENGWVFESKT